MLQLSKLLSFALLASLALGSLSACTSQTDTIINNQTQVLRADPNNVSALIERGNAYRDKKEYTLALADHNKAIELSASSGRAYLGRGMDYLALNQYEKALADFNQAITLNPELNEAYARRGETSVKLQMNYQQALADFNKALTLGYINKDLYRYQGQAYFRLNQRDQAIEAYLKAGEPDAVGANGSVSDLQVSELQLETLTEALDLGLIDPRIYLQRGKLRRIKKQYTSAVEDFSKALAMNSQNPEIYEERADAYFSMGQCTRAEQDLRSACRLGNRRLCEAITLGCSVPSPEPSPSP